VNIKMKYLERIGSYYYYRRAGKRWPLKGAPGSAQFLKDYAKAEDEFKGVPLDGTDSLARVIDDYIDSPEFKGLSEGTRRNYTIYINKIRPVFGPASIHDIKRKHIRDFRRATPKAGNQMIRVFKAVLGWAVNNDIIEVNPAVGIKMVKEGEHIPWPEPLIERFMSEAPAHLVWVVAVGLWTGQRKERVLGVRWDDITDGVIHFAAHKGGNEVWVPVLPALDAVLSTIPKQSLRILTDRRGRVWKEDLFGYEFRKYMQGIGAGKYKFHGLRKNFLQVAAEASGTPAELKSWSGHKSDAMVSFYIERADRKRLANSMKEKLLKKC